ncbi:retrovirus-related Pol polyprotein from transposon 17.6 [Trichonephila clavipes]|nr:retrovirus-related Pol polyprotein from transposon 17.6 [Trichonephila clavipes]
MITNFFIPELNNRDVQKLWFQQNGATCHTARATIDLLKDTFGDRLISRFGPVNWPPRSCDLTPLDYFLWGYVKSLVYADKPQTLDHLEDNIRRVIADIRPQMLEKVIKNWTSRWDYIRASRGSHMPKLYLKCLVISKEGIETDNSKVKAIPEMKPPKNSKEVSKFLGMAGWYQKFIPMYADISEPLYRLKKKGAKFNLSTEAQDSFDKIKRALTEAPVLQLPNFTEQFNLFTDASGVGIGVVINQNHRPIAFASRTLNKADQNYTVTERECLAVIQALNKFKTYFGSLPVKSNDQMGTQVIRVQHRMGTLTGVQNVVANVLSRNLVGNMDGSQISCAALRALALNSREQLIRDQREDPELGHIYRYLENPDDGSVNATVCEAGRLIPIVSNYPDEIATLDLLGPYPASRPERYRFLLVITDHFTKWSELIPLRKASAQAIANALFENYISRYGAAITLISDNGPQFISEVFEHLSHRLDIKHMKTATYRPQANLTERVNHNLVQMITCFVEENHENWDGFLHEFAFALRTSVNETTNKTPAELFLDRKIITPFSKLINVTEGAEYVGRNIEKLFVEARQNMRKQHKNWEKYYNRKRREVSIQVNDLVLVQTHFISAAGRRVVGKFMPKFEGPYRVLEVRNNNLIILKKGKRITVNSDQVRVYRPRQSDTISLDSHLETLYEGQRSSNRSSRSQPGKFKGSRKTSRITVHCRSFSSTTFQAGQVTYRREQARRKWTIQQRPGRQRQLKTEPTGQLRGDLFGLKGDSSETLSVLHTQPSKTTRRISRGVEEHRNRQYPTEQHQEKEPQYESLRRRSSG